MEQPTWVVVAGGVCRYGDRGRPCTVRALAWTRTPVTWAQAGREPPADRGPDTPITHLTHSEAVVLAADLGGQLPTSTEWEWMAAGPDRRRYPWGDYDWTPDRANLRPSGRGRPTPVDGHSCGATPAGVFDVAGNVWEWTASPVLGAGAIVRGGSYGSPPLYARTTFLNAAPRELRSAGIGLRVVRTP
jgi:iron(II)-dependent oxidoreductase